jgi:hypothetical protein
MKARRLTLSILALALAGATVSCSKAQDSADLEMGISPQGIILPVDGQSCVDVANVTAPPTYSLTAPVVSFGGFSLLWKSTSKNLRVGALKITIKSQKLSGGKFVGYLDGTEIEALVGATNATLTKADTADGRLYSSNSTTKEPSSSNVPSRPCAFQIGGLTLTNPNDTSQTFTAQVQIDLIGVAFDPNDPGSQTVVRKTVSASATAY